MAYDKRLRRKQLKRKRDQKKPFKPTIWHIPGNLWAKFQAVLPPEKPVHTLGRAIVPYRTVMNGLLYKLRTGGQWKAIPNVFGSGSTCHRRFQEWVQAGIFAKLMRILLQWYDRVRGIAWNWQVLDSVIVPAPLGGGKTGKNPTDRAKSGTKRHVLTDRRGVPLAVTLSGANEVDKQYVVPTLQAQLVRRPPRAVRTPTPLFHFAADKSYDDADVRRTLRRRGYVVHIAYKRKRGEPKTEPAQKGRRHPARRWVVERTNSWHNRFRSLKLRWERKPENYLALVQFACVLIIFRFLG
jgi:putative transposase